MSKFVLHLQDIVVDSLDILFEIFRGTSSGIHCLSICGRGVAALEQIVHRRRLYLIYIKLEEAFSLAESAFGVLVHFEMRKYAAHGCGCGKLDPQSQWVQLVLSSLEAVRRGCERWVLVLFGEICDKATLVLAMGLQLKN